MRTPRVPSLLHFVRFASREQAKIEHRLREMAKRPPRISYTPSKRGARDHLVLGVSQSSVLESVARIPAEQQRTINEAALNAFFVVAPNFMGRRFADIDKHYFYIGRNMHVPVNPFLYTVGPHVETILWPSFWNQLNLSAEQLAVFATILDLAFLSSPDYSGCSLEFADLGCAPGTRKRSPHIMSRGDLPTLTTSELKQFTDPFVEALLKIRAEALKEMELTRNPTTSPPTDDWYLDRSPPR